MTGDPMGLGGDPVLDREPVAVFVGGLAALVDAGIVAAASLGWLDLTPQQSGAIVAFVTFAAGFVVSTLRQFVYCRATARRAGITS